MIAQTAICFAVLRPLTGDALVGRIVGPKIEDFGVKPTIALRAGVVFKAQKELFIHPKKIKFFWGGSSVD